MDPHYPTIDASFLHEQLSNCTNLEDSFTIGKTTTYIEKGSKPIFKRQILVRENKHKQVSFEQSTAIAIRCNFLPDLLKWLEDNKNFKSGGYVAPKS